MGREVWFWVKGWARHKLSWFRCPALSAAPWEVFLLRLDWKSTVVCECLGKGLYSQKVVARLPPMTFNSSAADLNTLSTCLGLCAKPCSCGKELSSCRRDLCSVLLKTFSVLHPVPPAHPPCEDEVLPRSIFSVTLVQLISKAHWSHLVVEEVSSAPWWFAWWWWISSLFGVNQEKH